ncbi:aminotransferase class IV [Luethyella okanaganae]|uniref:Aminotransferase class IV n=1 Tax=Luethyella okanaganae TaxID=69372 RepID=A0ABW1VD01_9MICO
MTETDAAYRWLSGGLRLIESCETSEPRLEVADSWLVENGLVRALELHRERFERSAASVGWADTAALAAFWAASLAAIPRDGLWFPRVELLEHEGGLELRFRLRPAPGLGTALTLAVPDVPDPRRVPSIKGPDIPALMRLRQRAQRLGAQEAMILTPDGSIVDGSTTALLWWRHGALRHPPAEMARVDSVTARTIMVLAAAFGVETHGESVLPGGLGGCVVWAVNALHGIRQVTSIVDGPELAADDRLLAIWRRRLTLLRKPLTKPEDWPED